MKVLIATPYFWPQVGGMENYTRFLARGPSEAGCEVVVVCGDRAARRPTLDALPLTSRTYVRFREIRRDDRYRVCDLFG